MVRQEGALTANQTNIATSAATLTPILGSIICTPPTVTAGESVSVEVRGPDGKAYDNAETTPISMNGVMGSKRNLVWTQPGSQTIVVLARRPGAKTEKMTTTVQVNPAAEGAGLPSLRVQWSPESPTVGRFSVVRASPKNTKVPAPTVARVNPAGLAARELLSATVTRVSAAAAKAGARAVTAAGGVTEPIYTWQFSDGRALGTTRGACEHDFGPSLDPNRAYSVFHVAVTIQDPGKTAQTMHRSLTVHNPYHLMKRRGVLQPPTAKADLNLKFSNGAWRGSLTVRNPEAFDMTLTRQHLDFVHDEEAPQPAASVAKRGLKPQAALVQPAASQASVAKSAAGTIAKSAAGAIGLLPAHALSETVNIVLKAKAETKIDVVIAGKRLPTDVVAISVQFMGAAPNHLPVRICATMDVPQHVSQRFHLTAAAAELLTKLAQSGGVTNPRSVKSSELASLARAGVIKADALKTLLPPPMHVLDAHRPPDPAKEGGECDPWNLPDVVPDGMFCMPTAETRHVLMPARFMNAMKGDIILSPGDGSLISSVLSTVDPPQAYSHSGMMTRNRDEITHSTGTLERMVDSDSGFVGASGFRPDILKYVWPGVITQTVKHSVDGEEMTDPETGKPYTVSGFGSLQTVDEWSGQVSVTMVVKPDPLNETSDVRTQLHGIADFAAQQAGKSHYRFFCYTDPTIGLTTKAPNEAKWAAGTFPSVCSSLIWMSIRQSGVPIEGALEAADMNAGAQIAAGTPDGLYVYQGDERRNAGEVLYARIANLARQAAGQIGSGLTDIEDDLGNQVLNSFASDWSDDDATESDKWKQTTDANAVSPQNLTFYDAPLYGYSEPLIYRDERFEEITVYRWKHVAQTGTITGTVRFQGDAVAGADVQLTESQATHTDANGRFTLDKVPIGDAIVNAQKVINSVLMTAEAKTTVTGDQTTNVDINLTPPSHVFRRMVIDGSLFTTDYEFAAAAYPRNSSEFNGLADLDPGNATHAVKIFDCVADDDTLGRLILSFDLNTDDSITVKATIRCYDSNKPDTDDYDEGSLAPFAVKAGFSGNWHMFVDGENRAEVWFSLRNETNQS